jgi:hypothetical protein
MNRLTFLSHFVLCLACAGASFFAWQRGVFQKIYAIDMSMMSSLIAVLFVGTAIWLGWQAWRVDDANPEADASWGHDAERLSVICGFVGTAGGLAMQMQTMATAGIASLAYLGTSLFTTLAGGVSAGLILLMTRNLEQGIKRSRR